MPSPSVSFQVTSFTCSKVRGFFSEISIFGQKLFGKSVFANTKMVPAYSGPLPTFLVRLIGLPPSGTRRNRTFAGDLASYSAGFRQRSH